MALSEIYIKASFNTPVYHFNPDGVIKIKGRALMGDRTEVPEQIMDWIG